MQANLPKPFGHAFHAGDTQQMQHVFASQIDTTQVNGSTESKVGKSGKSSRREIPDLRILVVDDELWSALDMEWVVRRLGHDVVGSASTAEDAIRIAEESEPDLILMDIRLADGSDGVSAAIEIRQRLDIPSLFVSAHGEAVTRRRAEVAKPVGFIEKPFAPETLAHAIKRAFEI